jgi:HEAT repeat protein
VTDPLSRKRQEGRVLEAPKNRRGRLRNNSAFLRDFIRRCGDNHGMSDPQDQQADYHAELKADARTIPQLIADVLADLESDEENAVGVLHYFRDSAEVFVAAQKLCVSNDSRERELGAWILGQLGWEKRLFLDESVALLITMLDDEEDDVVAGAAVALGFRHDTRAVRPLIAQSTHWNSEVRGRVAWGLGS